jgi:hypothetical protein
MGIDGLMVMFAVVVLFTIGYYAGRIHTMRKVAEAVYQIRKEMRDQYKK